MRLALQIFLFGIYFFMGCTKKETTPVVLTPQEVGRKIYSSQCISCHNINPKLDGGLGPAVWGSSRELLQSKLIKGQYPEGYTPKRTGGVMPLFPQLEKDLDALYQFLNQ